MQFFQTSFRGIFSVVRILFGLMWLQSGYEKLVGGFSVESLVPVIAMNTDTPGWYKQFFAQVVDPCSPLFDYMIPFGELLIGTGLILGVLIVPALVMAIFIHVNYVLADMIFTYPVQIMSTTLLLVCRKSTSYLSLDRYIYSRWRNSSQ